jgi:uncharacterized protein YpbB
MPAARESHHFTPKEDPTGRHNRIREKIHALQKQEQRKRAIKLHDLLINYDKVIKKNPYNLFARFSRSEVKKTLRRIALIENLD